MCPVAPTEFGPKYESTSVVDAVRVVPIIPIKGANPPLYSTWAKNLFAYIKNLYGNNINIVFYNYNSDGDHFFSLSQERLERFSERSISSLNEVSSNANEWSEFLPNRKNKLRLCNLLADYFTSVELVGRLFYNWKSAICNKGKFVTLKVCPLQVCPLLCSEHKVEDHRITNHAKYGGDNDDNKNCLITIIADDTDIYILLIRIVCCCRSPLYFNQGTSSSKAGILYHNVSAAGSEFAE